MTVPSEASYDVGAHLNFSDVAIDNPKDPSLLWLRIKASKTDWEWTSSWAGLIRTYVP